jgi:hypothetical protein
VSLVWSYLLVQFSWIRIKTALLDWKMPTPIPKTYFPTIFIASLHPPVLTDVNASHNAVADR